MLLVVGPVVEQENGYLGYVDCRCSPGPAPSGAALVRRGLRREEKIMSCIHIHSKCLICFSGEKT